jgi:hypothetical protein
MVQVAQSLRGQLFATRRVLDTRWAGQASVRPIKNSLLAGSVSAPGVKHDWIPGERLVLRETSQL